MNYDLKEYIDEKECTTEYELFIDFLENVYVICDDTRKKELINELIDIAIENNMTNVSFREKVNNVFGSEIKAVYEIDLDNDLSVTATRRKSIKENEYPIYRCILEQTLSNTLGCFVVENSLEEVLYNGQINAARLINDYNGVFTELVVNRKTSDKNNYSFRTIEDKSEKIKSIGSMFNLRYRVSELDKSYSTIFEQDKELLRNYRLITEVASSRKEKPKKIMLQ